MTCPSCGTRYDEELYLCPCCGADHDGLEPEYEDENADCEDYDDNV